jgi:hypothetical protein
MSVKLTENEMQELQNRFSIVLVNESISDDIIIHTLLTGRIVKGSISENNVLQVKSVSDYLCG